MQLNNDLSIQTSFVQNYQTYLAQLVGFFVIEERVGRVSQALSGGEVISSQISVIVAFTMGLNDAAVLSILVPGSLHS